jgi:hypothetical protein
VGWRLGKRIGGEMNTTSMNKTRWFWPWQDEKEEAWLGEMSMSGWHLKSVHLPCVYTFDKGEPCRKIYRLDYMLMKKDQLEEYKQIFQDAGWEYVGEMSNWRYWVKQVADGETPEIFTDNESKIKKYQRLLGMMALFLVFLCFIGFNMFRNQAWDELNNIPLINAIYFLAMLCYVVVIPIYVVVVIKLVARINELKEKRL